MSWRRAAPGNESINETFAPPITPPPPSNSARPTPAFDAQAIEAFCHSIDLRPSAVAPIGRGFGNENWRVDSSDGRFVVKVGLPSTDGVKWLASTVGRATAAAHGLPVQELRYQHPAASVLRGRPVRVLAYVDGVHPATLSAPAAVRFCEQLGEAVARLHAIACDGFSSRLNASAPVFSAWSEYLGYRIAQIQRRVVAVDLCDVDALAPLWERVLRTARSLDAVIEPRLTHRDLHLDNLIATPAGDLAAIIDFDGAEAWDPVADFFKIELWSLSGLADPRSARAGFDVGYGGRPRDFRDRWLISCVLEIINGAANQTDPHAPFRCWNAAVLGRLLADTDWPSPEIRAGVYR